MKKIVVGYVLFRGFFLSELACGDAWIDTMAAEMATCSFNGFLNGSYDPEEGKDDIKFFKVNNIKPYKQDEDYAFIKVNYSYYGMHVSEVMLPVGDYALMYLYIDKNLDFVKAKLDGVLERGFYLEKEWNRVKSGPFKKKPVLMKDSESDRTILFCENPNN